MMTTPRLIPVRTLGGMTIIVQMNAVHPSASRLIKLLRQGPEPPLPHRLNPAILAPSAPQPNVFACCGAPRPTPNERRGISCVAQNWAPSLAANGVSKTGSLISTASHPDWRSNGTGGSLATQPNAKRCRERRLSQSQGDKAVAHCERDGGAGPKRIPAQSSGGDCRWPGNNPSSVPRRLMKTPSRDTLSPREREVYQRKM